MARRAETRYISHQQNGWGRCSAHSVRSPMVLNSDSRERTTTTPHAEDYGRLVQGVQS
ncbi:hypothetical protein BDZ89DRAFT_1065474 [Hymenopellis radicata]|nr:hypothetical protein BDZ89DRAFT_1065474 [Hymenopellis radicata]